MEPAIEKQIGDLISHIREARSALDKAYEELQKGNIPYKYTTKPHSLNLVNNLLRVMESEVAKLSETLK